MKRRFKSKHTMSWKDVYSSIKRGPGRPRKARYWGSVFTLIVIVAIIALIGNNFAIRGHFDFKVLAAEQEKQAVEKTAEQLEKEVAELRDKLNLPKEMEELEKSNDAWTQFVLGAKKASEIYNYPLKVILAQCALESARGTEQIKPNNFCGIAAYDHNPAGNAWSFENPAQTAIEYMQIIKENFPTAWANRDNPDLMIKYIKYDPATNLMYAKDPAYVNKVTNMPEWRLY